MLPLRCNLCDSSCTCCYDNPLKAHHSDELYLCALHCVSKLIFSLQVNWFAIESSDRWCIDVGGSIGVVATTKQAIKCLNCQKSNCCHAREIKGLLQQDYPHHMSSSAVLKPKSCQVIPFVTYLRKESIPENLHHSRISFVQKATLGMLGKKRPMKCCFLWKVQ